MWFPNSSDTNRPVQSQKQARSLKFRSYVEEELYNPCSETKALISFAVTASDQLCGYREADLRLCFRLCRLFSHEAAPIIKYLVCFFHFLC